MAQRPCPIKRPELVLQHANEIATTKQNCIRRNRKDYIQRKITTMLPILANKCYQNGTISIPFRFNARNFDDQYTTYISWMNEIVNMYGYEIVWKSLRLTNWFIASYIITAPTIIGPLLLNLFRPLGSSYNHLIFQVKQV